MTRTVETLPAYLRKYCVEQPEDKYTSRDQAAWRYIMRQSRAFFQQHGVPIYLEGLKKTGITVDRIPLIREMDEKLRELGWGAVPVCGFIPPAAFLDFQARKILPIAYDMRSVEHLHYTPAPDIVHEAAGHAPIIADPEYADYLTMYAAMAQKAIFSAEDMELYEAIRTLSDVKENPDSTPDQKASADRLLKQAVASVTFASEATKVARMNWWTVEYGLLGSMTSPKIYGAGLLSSVGESQSCLGPKVRKMPLTLACTEVSYDITEPQPQLFVAEDIAHLRHVLAELEATLAFHRGGAYGLEQALKGRTVTTTVLDSGLSISGKLVAAEGLDFVRFEGPTALFLGKEPLEGQGTTQHPTGFSTPIGRFKSWPDRDPSRISDQDLRALTALEFTNGFVVRGKVTALVRDPKTERLLIVKWRECTVTRGGEVYFRPEWGDFDMGVGTSVVSVYGGPANREAFGSHDVGTASTTPGRTSPFTALERRAFDAYSAVRALREQPDRAAARRLAESVARDFPDEWLLRLETLELFHDPDLDAALARDAARFLPAIQSLIKNGLKLK